MKVQARIDVVKKKFAYYVDEVRGLRDGGWYSIFFGLLIVLLIPLFLFEIVILMLFGKDFGMFQSSEPDMEPKIDIDEVPINLRDLFPFAKKWGVGDDGDRGDLIEAASNEELDELRKAVGPRMDEIAQWVTNISEDEIRKSDTAGLFLHLMDAFEEAEFYNKKEEA